MAFDKSANDPAGSSAEITSESEISKLLSV